MSIVTSVFKGTTLKKKMRLYHVSLRRPETRIVKGRGETKLIQIVNVFKLLKLFCKMITLLVIFITDHILKAELVLYLFC